MSKRTALEKLNREELIAEAERLSISTPRLRTQPELMDEIIRLTAPNERERRVARGWFGIARDLLARVVEKGLHLPEAAKFLRSVPPPAPWPEPRPPMPTVTLAEIYVAQGHIGKAISVLNDVIGNNPKDREALDLRTRLQREPQTENPTTETRAVSTKSESVELKPVAKEPKQTEQSAEPISISAENTPSTTSEPVAPIELDEVVALATNPTTIYVYWEIRPRTFARMFAKDPSGKMALRIVFISATWDGPQEQERTVYLSSLTGDQFIHDIPPSTHVRVCIGWLGQAFTPLSIAMDLVAPRSQPSQNYTLYFEHPFSENAVDFSGHAHSALIQSAMQQIHSERSATHPPYAFQSEHASLQDQELPVYGGSSELMV